MTDISTVLDVLGDLARGCFIRRGDNDTGNANTFHTGFCFCGGASNLPTTYCVVFTVENLVQVAISFQANLWVRATDNNIWGSWKEK